MQAEIEDSLGSGGAGASAGGAILPRTPPPPPAPAPPRARINDSGPGVWAFVDLANQFSEVVGEDAVPASWVWERRSGDGSRRVLGGRVPATNRHSTVLIRLNEPWHAKILQEVASKTRPFTITPSCVYLSRAERLCSHSNGDVFALGIALKSDGLVQFRKDFLHAVHKASCDPTIVPRDDTLSESTNKTLAVVASLAQKHNPYASETGGHVSIAYLRDGTVLAEAKQLVSKVNARLNTNSACLAINVDHLCVKARDGSVTKMPLGNVACPVLQRRGVTFSALEYFARTHAEVLTAETTTKQVVESIIVPETKELASSYVQFLAQPTLQPRTQGVVNDVSAMDSSDFTTGPADFFVSHAWSYFFLDLLATLRQHHQQEQQLPHGRRRRFYWLDIFAVNQHNIFDCSELPMLETVVAESQEVLVVLSPWQHPTALTRIWCLFEIFTAMTHKTPVAVVVPPREVPAFEEALANDFSSIRAKLCDIDSAKAQATNPLDLKRIQAQIQATIGCNGLNVLVKDRMRSWLLETVERKLCALPLAVSSASSSDVAENSPRSGEEELRRIDWLHSVAGFLGEFGKLERAADLYSNVIKRRQQLLGDGHASTIAAAVDLGFLLPKIQRAPEAVALLKKQATLLVNQISSLEAQPSSVSAPAKRTRFPSGRKVLAGARQSHLTDSQTGGSCDALIRQSWQADGEEVTFTDEIACLRKTLLLVENNVAMALGTLPASRDEALKLYEHVLQSRTRFHGTGNNADSIATMNNMAWLLARMGRQTEAEPLFRKVFAFRGRRRGDGHPSTLNAGQNLGETLFRMGRLQEAETLLKHVASGKIENMGVDNTSTLKAIVVLAQCLESSNKIDEARAWARKLSGVDQASARLLAPIAHLRR
eukprot:INCI1270.1.p1 GENE.INCI1270.1~~INCI1270.1.p1  ORF type:complete len:883 (-),score=166.74 INCI1270.1:880-3528(-)